MKRKLLTWFLAASLAVTGAIGLASCANNEQPEENKPGELEVQTLTCAEAIVKANEIGETESEERFIIKGKVKSIKSEEFGEFTIEDNTGELFVFHSFNADGTIRYKDMTDKPLIGDDIIIKTKLHAFKGNGEAVDAWIIDFKHAGDGAYTKMSITEARNAAVNTKVEVEGTVAYITKTNPKKMTPNGFYLVSDTDSIYVYDANVANQLKVGNKITLRGTKKMFISENEQEFAEKFNYKGACQLDSCTLVKNDEQESALNLDFAEETTIKTLINKPNDENFTNKIYKVDAYIKKEVAPTWTTYRLNDLDDMTGSHIYTNCDGNDFAFLDEYVGKICTVYVTVHSMKSEDSGCTKRFIPIVVKDENFKFDLTKTNQFVLDYVLDGIFKTTYNVSPEIDVPTSYENNNLGISSVEIKWSTNTPDMVRFENSILYISNKKVGEASVIATICHNGVELKHEFKINMVETPVIEFITVGEAIEKLDKEVTVKGVAGPSLINKTGFYLIDDSGVISVLTSKSEMQKIKKMGNLVTIKGNVKNIGVKKGETVAKMRVIENATIELNEFGSHAYSTKTFITGKTIEDLLAMIPNLTNADTTKVFKTKMVIKANLEGFKNYYIVPEKYLNTELNNIPKDEQIRIYNDGNRCDYLLPLVDKVVDAEMAFCNYNGKQYLGAILSVTDGVTTLHPMENYQ